MGIFKNRIHPRNPYKKRVDFQELVVDYPELRQHAETDLSGKIKMNFKDREGLICFTKTLLKKDFNLDVEIPSYTLVPTLTMRLNYLLWIEDLLDLNGIQEAKGIDIGTGATCIFGLLGAQKFAWNILATETDERSIKCAQENIERNSLSNKVTVRSTTEDKILVGVIKEGEDFHFSVCNPPFFSGESELSSENKARTDHRSLPGNAQTGSHNELITPGGEVQFVSRIIEDSCVLKNQIRIYTTMVGHKKHVEGLIGQIKKAGIPRYTQTDFFQGRTQRWGIAWSFDASIKFPPEETRTKKPKETPYSADLPPGPEENIQGLQAKLLSVLENLEISVTSQEEAEDAFCLDAVAFKNTWCRKYRRRMLHKEDEGPAPKKLKSENETPLVHFTMGLLYQPEGSHMELTYIDGSGGREAAFNLLKHITKEMSPKEAQ